MSTLDGCDGKKRIEFHSSSGVVAERHISTPWRDPDRLRRANVEIKLERGHVVTHPLWLWHSICTSIYGLIAGSVNTTNCKSKTEALWMGRGERRKVNTPEKQR